jgi:hypothetical protein
MKMFEAITDSECCLCGSTSDLTGEHKIKASALRRIFGKDAMIIGHFDGEREPRLAQGPKSSEFHFGAKLCGTCNASGTQPADRTFDQFHEEVARRFDAGLGADDLFPAERYSEGAAETLNIFRYFGKLLVCQVADTGGPRLTAVAQFVVGRSDFNPVKLKIRADATYQDFTQISDDFLGFAGHGGLVINHSCGGVLSGFHSTLSLGPIQYVYWVEFRGDVSADLAEADPRFFAVTREAFRKSMKTPMTDHERRKLGFEPTQGERP